MQTIGTTGKTIRKTTGKTIGKTMRIEDDYQSIETIGRTTRTTVPCRL